MGAKRTQMHRLEELVRLHRLGQTARAIARQLKMGRDTVRQYVRVLGEAGVLDGAVDDLPGVDALKAIIDERVGSTPPLQQRSSLEQYADEIKRRRANGAGPTAIHDWLRLHRTDYAGTLSAVKRMCLRFDRERGPVEEDVALVVTTAPGEIAQVDFGYAGKRYDPRTRTVRRSWLFVMTLGFSRHMYVDLVFDQRIETWLALHVRAFAHFGGVPAVLVPDNLKAAVVRAAFGVEHTAVLNRSYCELARHYGFRIDPTPPRSPEKKGKVERAVRYVKGSFLSTWESVDVDIDREALARWAAEVAAKRRHGTTGRAPIELFEEQERAALMALPAQRFELVLWKRVKVHRDSHVQIDGALYSVPWKHLGAELWARCAASGITLYLDEDRLATHALVRRGQRSTDEAHLPASRRDHRHRGEAYWRARAGAMGAEVEALIGAIFESSDVLYQIRAVQAVVLHLESHPVSRARAAARRALYFGALDYRSIKSILRKALDLEPLEEPSREREWSRGARFARRPLDFARVTHGASHVHPR